MPKIRFIATWSEEYQKGVTKGLFVIKPADIYRKNLGSELNKLKEMQAKNGELRELVFDLEYHYRKRTLDQNALMWALYEIEANEMNAGLKGQDRVTAEQLYHDDKLQHAPMASITIQKDLVQFLKNEYEVVSEVPVGDAVELKMMIGTSKFNVKQMAEWIDMLFNRIASNGVPLTNPGEIQHYWSEWRAMLNDEKIILHDDVLTQDEYKALNPICEASGVYLGDGSGQLHHINTRGMGGNEEPWKNYASNWLHLSQEAHSVFHDQGPDEFVTKYPHLAYKVKTALKRDYEDIPENKIHDMTEFQVVEAGEWDMTAEPIQIKEDDTKLLDIF